jgi:quercetin dioxygenase-like cupin family protein
MAYKSSPRPTFDGPTAIPYANVTRHLWGDAAAGQVDDWIYASSMKIHQLVFGLAPGQAFRHSPDFRTVFGADEVLYVLEGCYGSVNPETGEVHKIEAGAAMFFRKDTWHNGFSLGPDRLRVLEFFAPPPATGTSGAYAKTRPYVDKPKYGRDDLLGRWPMVAAEEKASRTMHIMRDPDLLWRLEGADQAMLVGLYCSTEHLTAGKARLLPGQKSDMHTHGGDEGLYVLSGTLNVLAPDADPQRWFELQPMDGFYVPDGAPHQYWNMTDKPVEFLFGVAPNYAPTQQP